MPASPKRRCRRHQEDGAGVTKKAHHVQFARLNDHVTSEQFFASLESEGEAALRFATLTGGVGVITPGQDGSVTVDFTQPGTYLLLCFVSNAEGVPHLALGMVAGFTVEAGN